MPCEFSRHEAHPTEGRNDSLRTAIRAEVEAIAPIDALEKADRHEVLRWIDSGAPLFRTQAPATPPKHLIAYFVVTYRAEVLLVDHKKAELWLPPGGHVDPGEHPRTTVQREIYEELGIHPSAPLDAPYLVTLTETVGKTAGHTDVSLWYHVAVDDPSAIRPDLEEFYGIRWFAPTDIPSERCDRGIFRFLKKLARGR